MLADPSISAFQWLSFSIFPSSDHLIQFNGFKTRQYVDKSQLFLIPLIHLSHSPVLYIQQPTHKLRLHIGIDSVTAPSIFSQKQQFLWIWAKFPNTNTRLSARTHTPMYGAGLTLLWSVLWPVASGSWWIDKCPCSLTLWGPCALEEVVGWVLIYVLFPREIEPHLPMVPSGLVRYSVWSLSYTCLIPPVLLSVSWDLSQRNCLYSEACLRACLWRNPYLDRWQMSIPALNTKLTLHSKPALPRSCLCLWMSNSSSYWSNTLTLICFSHFIPD